MFYILNRELFAKKWKNMFFSIKVQALWVFLERANAENTCTNKNPPEVFRFGEWSDRSVLSQSVLLLRVSRSLRLFSIDVFCWGNFSVGQKTQRIMAPFCHGASK